MNDEGLRLTPADVRAQEIRRKLFGYDVAAVEDLQHRVADEMEHLLRVRATLEERVKNLQDQLHAYEKREKTINEAVMMAQRIREEADYAANRQSELVIREARADADRLLAEARAAEGDVRRDIEVAQRQFSSYMAAFRRLLERQLAEVDALVDHEKDGSPQGEQ